ncbi:MAG TPA: nicotinate phosphoribosyltransferase [Hungateiclostridium thermocellum]|jgi:nicotinate phosphoribosyltransferase|uniref:Nicotinate phosphoribosyltransferase n=2 Tax=Acetivibrio thermocellus TaxID=1515 RepID=A3DEN0_ACET2|nr:nicotinate phosphoribosyltransferase [Acetivibrio thermocellus]ABN52409.1 nicotinate phosphoribosyltransferase [Acetivibrio thermocellus ATCC 27405]ADU74146.1 nicotinate phosphoribosyltransferase [Acetivibrio thermocellus DSM 1313]ALX08088.1 nicotinate phosphoribosyltransferase [Acetivibrio thermocellus AD2]ANV75835.1 nicotinate phosphoribosyltransferase [Acetivibrio thermocellus DSM 2360]EIC06021.1 nicotinate phosphoribosyltransferase [Acetivibrio thermocellus YS]
MKKINWNQSENLSMLTDFYELTMGNGYFENGIGDRIAYFDMFFRRVPENGGFAIMAGLAQVIEYINNLKFEDDDIEFLRSKGIFSEDFLKYLKDFKFCCDIWAIPEGTPIFPNEPIITVRGPVIQAQFIETMILLTINHQSLIATKANRIVRAAQGRPVLEFGTRRAQGYDGAVLGARAAYIGGCAGTACAIADRDFGVPASGTMAHSWVQLFPSELEAFRAYARVYPDNCVLLVDTYNVLKSGVPNAIKVFKEEVVPRGFRPKGIRIDSGDIAYLSKEARKMLDEAGFPDCKIVVSNSLDEYIIRDILQQGAQVDIFGVGERLITSKTEPVFGGVYKLVAVEENGTIIPKIKMSENVVKITNPGYKKVFRLFDRKNNKAIADVIVNAGEVIDDSKPYEIFDPDHTWKRKTVTDFYAKELQVQIFDKGKCVYKVPEINEIRDYCREQINTLWDEVLRFENPHKYYVDLSEELWNIKNKLLKEHTLL